MAVVGSIWIYSMSERFNSKVSVQTKEDVKPFSLLGKSLADTYSNISASIGSASLGKTTTDKKNVVTSTPDKVIDLIPVEHTQ